MAKKQYLCDMCRRDCSISKQMYSDLIRSYCKACENSWTMMEACDKAVRMPAPRFYITPKQARKILAPMMKGDFERVDLYDPLKRKMYYELYDIVINMCEKREFIGKSLCHIVQFAVMQPASQFFIDGHTLYCIRQDIRMGRVTEEGKQRSHLSRGIRKSKKR